VLRLRCGDVSRCDPPMAAAKFGKSSAPTWVANAPQGTPTTS
jgi:hypothetical protein